jgi:hypothetical protein
MAVEAVICFDVFFSRIKGVTAVADTNTDAEGFLLASWRSPTQDASSHSPASLTFDRLLGTLPNAICQSVDWFNTNVVCKLSGVWCCCDAVYMLSLRLVTYMVLVFKPVVHPLVVPNDSAG